MSEPLPTLEIPATSAEYIGVPIWAKDDETPIDLTTGWTPRLAFIEPDAEGVVADPIETDWHTGVWHKRAGALCADVLLGDDFTPTAGKTYAIFAQAKGTDEAPYRQVGWLQAT